MFRAAAALSFALAGGSPPPQIVIVPAPSTQLDDASEARLLDAARAGAQRTEGYTFALGPHCADRACIDKLAAQPGTAAAVIVSATAQGRNYAYRIELIDPSLATPLSIEDACDVCGLEEVGALMEGSVATLLERYSRARVPASLSLQTTPAGAQVSRGDEILGTTPLQVTLSPGQHTVTLKLPGYEPQRRTVSVGAGEAVELDVDLVAAPVAPRPVRPHRPLAIAGGVVLGLGVAALATGAVLVAIDERSQRCTDDEANEFGVCPRRYATLEGGAVALGIGGAALITGIVLQVVAGRRKRAQNVALSPTGVSLRF